MLPVFLTYALSFIYLGIYWNNHHHLLKAAHKVNGGDDVGEPAPALLAVALPVRHRLDGRKSFHSAPTALYGAVMLLAAIAYYILQSIIVAQQGPDSKLAKSIGRDFKGKASPVALRLGHRHGVFRALDFRLHLCAGRVDVAHPRPAHRTRRG